MQTAPTTAPKKFPWLIVSLGIIVALVGYSFVIKGQPSAVANGYSCPVQQICKGGDCMKNNLCAAGVCNKDCPGNCPHSA